MDACTVGIVVMLALGIGCARKPDSCEPPPGTTMTTGANPTPAASAAVQSLPPDSASPPLRSLAAAGGDAGVAPAAPSADVPSPYARPPAYRTFGSHRISDVGMPYPLPLVDAGE